MRVSYRFSAGAVLIVVGFIFASKYIPVSDVPMCLVRGDLSSLGKVAVVVWPVSFVILMVQGLRNRGVPRWLSIISLVAFVFLFYGDLEMRVTSDCYTRSGILRVSVWMFAVGLMCLHQIFQRPIAFRATRSTRYSVRRPPPRTVSPRP
jgi:hypothetical protein